MPKNTGQIIWLILLLGFISIMSFLSLLLFIPLIALIIFVILFGIYSYRWMANNVFVAESKLSPKTNYASYIILLAGVVILTNKLYYFEHKYGDWDAWLIWNYHAKFLQHPEYWKQLFTINKSCHPDYPLFLPGNIAFCWRLFRSDTMLVPFAYSYLFTLLIPVLIFLTLYRKNLFIAGLILLLLATDEFYLIHAIAQYADAPLGFLLLCIIIVAGYLNTNKYIPLIIGAILGCCMWMKNEGAMLTIIFCLFYIKSLMKNGGWKYLLAGIALPLITLLVFKSMAPVNDLMTNRTTPLSTYLTDGSRYKLIASYLADNMNRNFVIVELGLIVYVISCIIHKEWPGKNMFLLLTCVAGYFFVYLISNEGLEWHLQTSMDRVLLQLMPSFVYVIGAQLSKTKFPLLNKYLQ